MNFTYRKRHVDCMCVYRMLAIAGYFVLGYSTEHMWFYQVSVVLSVHRMNAHSLCWKPESWLECDSCCIFAVSSLFSSVNLSNSCNKAVRLADWLRLCSSSSKSFCLGFGFGCCSCCCSTGISDTSDWDGSLLNMYTACRTKLNYKWWWIPHQQKQPKATWQATLNIHFSILKCYFKENTLKT